MARIALRATHMIIDGKAVDLVPGMAVTAEIKTGKRRLLDYLLSPFIATVTTDAGTIGSKDSCLPDVAQCFMGPTELRGFTQARFDHVSFAFSVTGVATGTDVGAKTYSDQRALSSPFLAQPFCTRLDYETNSAR